jgi:hypothetical protein
VLVAEALLLACLHRLGRVDGFAIPRGDLGRWLQQTPSEDVLLVGIRLAALVAAWWLLATTLLYAAARLAHWNRAARAVGWATLPAVRRWVDRAAALSIVTGSVLGTIGPTAAEPPPTTSVPSPTVVVDLDHRDRPVRSTEVPASVRTGRAADAAPVPAVPAPTTAPAPTVAPPLPDPPPSTAPPPALPAASHVIAPGEHLWSIAAHHAAGDHVAAYWRRVVDLNRSRLRSGDPDLVYPGEVVELPSE